MNWMNNTEVKKALQLLASKDITNGKEQLLQIYQDLINKEFDKLTEHFLQKIAKTKESIFHNARELYSTTNINLEGFAAELRKLYNIDALIDIIQSLGGRQTDLNTINRDLCTLFEEINLNKEAEKNLEDIAKNINSFTKYYTEINIQPFEDLKASLNFANFDRIPFRLWSWFPDVKSSFISLDETNMIAQKMSDSPAYTTAVLGTLALSKGCHRWEIELQTRDVENSWMCFGIIETHLVKKVTNFPYCKAMGVDTYGRLHNMESEGLLVNYDNKIYSCELDMDNGTFTISYQGTVIAKQDKNIKGKIVVPFGTLGEPGNWMRLHVLTPV